MFFISVVYIDFVQLVMLLWLTICSNNWNWNL